MENLLFSLSLSKIITITRAGNTLYQATSNQIPTSLNSDSNPCAVNYGQDLRIKFYLCTGTPRAASIYSRLWAWQAGSTIDSSPKHLFPQAFLFQRGLVTWNRELITAPEIILIIQDCLFQKFQSKSEQQNAIPKPCPLEHGAFES